MAGRLEVRKRPVNPRHLLRLFRPLAFVTIAMVSIHSTSMTIVFFRTTGGKTTLSAVLGHNNGFCVLHHLPFALKVRVTFVLERETHAVFIPPPGGAKTLGDILPPPVYHWMMDQLFR
jgi:hypothetical protein